MVRYKKRYIVVELHDTRKLGSLLKLDGRNPELAVMKAVETMHGEYGAAMVQPLKVLFVSPKLGLLLLRVSFASYRLVLSSLPVLSNVGGVPASAKVLRVAATPNVAYKFLKEYNEKALEEFLASQEDFKLKMQNKEADLSDLD